MFILYKIINVKPTWRNRRRKGLKIPCPLGRPGSSPGWAPKSMLNSEKLVKLVIGAAQFGSNYGITNKSQISNQDINQS